MSPVLRPRSSVPSTEPDPEHWDMVIEPHRLDLKLGDLWRYKDLVMHFVRRDLFSVYKQTILV